MATEIKAPAFPESIADGTVLTWYKKPGDAVKRDENLVDIETDKVVLEVPASADGVLKEIIKKVGEKVLSQEVLGTLEAGAASQEKATAGTDKSANDNKSASDNKSTTNAPAQAAAAKSASATISSTQPASSQQNVQAAQTGQNNQSAQTTQSVSSSQSADLSPAVRRLIAEHNVDTQQLKGTGKEGRITRDDVINFVNSIPAQKETGAAQQMTTTQTARPATTQTQQQIPLIAGERTEQRVPMSRLRARIAERLLSAQHNAAILTTFNEVNLQAVMDLRTRYKDQFEKVHGVRLGFMSFFTKAAIEALKRFPMVNASLDGTDVIYHGYYDIGVAVSTDRGLVVPVIRNAEQLGLADIEKQVAQYGAKARDNQLTLEEMTGGTFTITNGGVFGSLLSTPIINPPQCAILGMHKIEERPIVEKGQIVIRPMMYLALSYDHRLIDGRDSVRFLVTIKEFLEDPARLLLEI